MKELIETTPGVTNVFNNTTPTHFTVYLDKRYNFMFVVHNVMRRIAEIEQRFAKSLGLDKS